MSHPIFPDALDYVKRYETSAESYEEQWKKDHNQAMECFQFEQLLAQGVFLFHFLNRIDELWRLRVHNNALEYKQDMETAIQELYRFWLVPCPRVMGRLQSFEKLGYNVTGAEDFRSACREVKGLLTPDDKFFADDAMVRLRDEAIDQHERGESFELTELSD